LPKRKVWVKENILKMLVPFESLPGNSRVWVYQANRKFNSTEADIISQELSSFVGQWEVHGQPMKASFKLFHNQFVVLAADEDYNAASGCSIDGSVRSLKQLGSNLDIDFFDRSAVAFKNNDEIFLIPVSQLKQALMSGKWNQTTLVFNNVIACKADVEKSWLAAAGKTWLKRYLPDEIVDVKQ
jgi:hypothetical protein